MRLKKQARREAIRRKIEENPFITDNELSTEFEVSIQTIRLDRTHLNIPELRKRIQYVAEENYERIQSIESNEIIGDVIEVQPNQHATSLIRINESSVFTRNRIARGHVVFAQANSLCVALIHKPIVLTKESQIKFVKPVQLHETVRAEAKVTSVSERYYTIEVKSFVVDDVVFTGTFKMYYLSEDEQNG